MKITKIEVQQKHKDRVNIYVDDVFYTGLDMATCVKHNLKANTEISQSAFDDVFLESEKQNAFNKAAKYLGRSLKTEKQIRDYLKGKGYDVDIIKHCVELLKSYNYLNDEEYALAYIRGKGKTCGIYKLKHDLAQRGVPAGIIENTFKEYKSKDDDIIKLALKKLNNKPLTYENLSKCMVYLSNKGFEHDDIKHAVNKITKGEFDESWD